MSTPFSCARPKRKTDRLRETFRPEVRCHARDRTRDLVLVARFDRKRDEAQTRVTDGEIVDVELERGCERGRLGMSHVSSLADMQNIQATNP